MKSLDCCITVMRVYCKKGGYYRGQACKLNVDKAVSLWGCIFWMGRLSIWYWIAEYIIFQVRLIIDIWEEKEVEIEFHE